VPLLVQYGELDPPDFQKQAALLNEQLCAVGRCPVLLKLPQHSHLSEVYAINTEDRSLTNGLAEFINRKP
jgi:triacylglycerol lipase